MKMKDVSLSRDDLVHVAVSLKSVLGEVDLQLVPMAFGVACEMLTAQSVIADTLKSELMPCVFSLIRMPALQGGALGAIVDFIVDLVKIRPTWLNEMRGELWLVGSESGHVTRRCLKSVAACMAGLCRGVPQETEGTVAELVKEIKVFDWLGKKDGLL